MNKELRALEAELIDAVERQDPDAAWPPLEQLIKRVSEQGVEVERFRQNVGPAVEALMERFERHFQRRPLSNEGDLPEILRTRGLAFLLTTHLVRAGEQEKKDARKSVEFDEAAHLSAGAEDSYIYREAVEDAIAALPRGLDRFVAALKHLEAAEEPWTPDRIAELAAACGLDPEGKVRSRADAVDAAASAFSLVEIAALVGVCPKTVQRSNARLKERIREALSRDPRLRQGTSRPKQNGDPDPAWQSRAIP